MLSAPAAAVLNHILRDAGWARERLRPFAGCSVRFEIPPLFAAFAVGSDGRLASASTTEPAAVVRMTGLTLIRLAWLRDETAGREVQIEGDSALASALTGVLSDLRWDVEEDLSRVVGDVAAHRLAQAGDAFLDWQAKAAFNLAQALAEYWTEEQPVLVGREALRQFEHAVDVLRDDAERLGKRVERLKRADG
ncbi:MAG TPA: SCP2 sterol-binding domain-containing protein [Burkholderiales bacterium]|nr:SCP2 sterol-binding domain-containing protein [Burkholderiales bacterium]